MAWYGIVLIISSGLFLIQMISSFFFGDTELGVDADVDTGSGFLWSDVVSFKGLLHFAIGFSLTLTLMNEFSLLSVSVGIMAGLVFMLALYYVYKIFILKFKQSLKYTTEIVDMEAEVYFWDSNKKIGEVFITLEGRPVTITLTCQEDVRFEKGQKIRVSGTRHSVSPIINH